MPKFLVQVKQIYWRHADVEVEAENDLAAIDKVDVMDEDSFKWSDLCSAEPGVDWVKEVK